MGLYGKYFASTYSTTGTNEDLVTKIKTSLSLTEITIKKLTIACTTQFHIKVNGGVASDMWLDSDNVCRLSLDANDLSIVSLVVSEGSISNIFVAIIY